MVPRTVENRVDSLTARPPLLVLHLIHGKFADFAAVAAIVAAVLAQAHGGIGLAEDAILLALASGFPHIAG